MKICRISRKGNWIDLNVKISGKCIFRAMDAAFIIEEIRHIS